MIDGRKGQGLTINVIKPFEKQDNDIKGLSNGIGTLDDVGVFMQNDSQGLKLLQFILDQKFYI